MVYDGGGGFARGARYGGADSDNERQMIGI